MTSLEKMILNSEEELIWAHNALAKSVSCRDISIALGRIKDAEECLIEYKSIQSKAYSLALSFIGAQ